MIGETPVNEGQQFYRYEVKTVSGNTVPAERNVKNISVQTGEEFSAEFLHDRIAQRRVPNSNQLSHVRYNYDQNHQVPNEDLTGIPGLRRRDSDCDALDFIPRTGHVAEAENRAFPDNISRYHWEYRPKEQKPIKYADEMKSDRVTVGHTSSPKCVVESRQSCHPYATGVSESAFSGKMKLLCSFGGRILPRPNDGKLRYVGGETRIISIRKNITWEDLAKKTSAICNHHHIIKYQLPGEDLDALISVCSNEDFYHMREEYQELERNGGSQRLRIFLVSSVEPDSPNSFEGKPPLQSDADYQYVVAVNGMLDLSPQKSSSGHSLGSQTTPLGTASDCCPTFHQDSPTAACALDNKDSSPSNLVGTFSNPASHFVNMLQIEGKSSNYSPPASPDAIHHRGHEKSNVLLRADQPFPNGSETISTFAVSKNPFDSAYHPNAYSYYDNLPRGPLHHRQYLVETDQTNKPSELHFLNRCPSGDFLPHLLHAQNCVHSERPMLKERAFSDSRLLEHEGSKYGLEGEAIPLSQRNNRGEKSPSLAMSNSSQERPILWQDIMDEKHQVARYENQCSFKTFYNLNQEVLKWMDMSVTSSDEDVKQCEGSNEAASNDNATEFKNLLNLNYPSGVRHHPQDLQESARMVSSTPVNVLANSEDSTRKQPHGHQSGTDVPDLFVKSSSAAKDQQCDMTERMSDQPVSHWLPGYLHSSQGSGDQEPQGPSSKSVTSAASCSLVLSFDEDPLMYPDRKVETVSIRGQSYEGSKIGDALHVHSQPSDGHDDNKVLESVVIVEDVTGNTPPDITNISKVVPCIIVEEDTSDEFPSHRDTRAESMEDETESEDLIDGTRDTDESISDVAMAEIEAGIYGLQIIKNSDIEELQELGSGTFGTVYYGKWRGTDVAIKRIKKSCFSGRLSEQERLSKDFWREARILSNLHHPNVVAFYGVVPDGPGGTMATVTEYMANGSLRHVLQKKDRALDRRKKLMIALDAAFGMEYLHLKDIIHFDLKCDNLLVNLRDPRRPICKVGDFGLSRIKRNTLVSGGVRGTLPWMAPELLDGSSNQVSEKVDVYSFGITMWEILTGEEPYSNMHCGAIIGGILSNTLRPSIPEHCDPEWRKLMEECWSYNPAARPSFTEITDRLRLISMAVQGKQPNLANR